LPYASQSFEIGGASIKVRIEPGHEYIRIEGGFSVIYEFFTTGEDINPNFTLELHQFDQLNNPGSATRINVGRATRSKEEKTKVTPQPMWSSIYETPDPLPDGGISWAFVDRRWWAQNHIRVGGQKLYVDNFASIFSQPSEHFGSYHWYYGNKKDELVTSCRASGPGASIGNLRPVTEGVAYLCSIVVSPKFSLFSYYPKTEGDSSPTEYFNGYAIGYTSDYPYAWLDTRVSVRPTFISGSIRPTNRPFMSDAKKVFESIRFNPESTNESAEANTFDIPPAVYVKTALAVGAGRAGPYIHWRTAALHKAKDADGKTVPVIVLTDTHNGFMFYVADNYSVSVPQPTTGELGAEPIGESYRNLSSTKWVRVKPTMPGWVSLPEDGETYKERTWAWRFNKKATRAVCTPVNSVPGLKYLKTHASITNATIHDDAASAPSGSVPVEVYSIPQVSPTAAAAIEAHVASIFAATGKNISPGVVGTSAHYFKYNGQYYGLSGTVDTSVSMTSAVKDYVVLAKDITPGVVEVEITVGVIRAEDGSVTLVPTVSVVYSDYYAQSGKVYSDAAYYVKTPRASKESTSISIDNYPDDDDLLLSDIVYKGRTDTRKYATPYVQIRPYVWYRVTNHTKSNVATTLCIAAQGGAPCVDGITDVSGTSVPTTLLTMFSVIVAHDLRYLAFITATYYRRMCLESGIRAVFGGGYGYGGVDMSADYNLAPRFELRVPGEPLKTINYGHPSYSGFLGQLNVSELSLAPDMHENGADVIEDRMVLSDIPPYINPAYPDEIQSGEAQGPLKRWYQINRSEHIYPGSQTLFDECFWGKVHLGEDPVRNINLLFQDGMQLYQLVNTVTSHSADSFLSYGTLLYCWDATSKIHYELIPCPLTDDSGVPPATKKRLAQSYLPFTTSGQYYMTFSFTPTGDYAVYFDARSAMWPTPTGTEVNGMFDVIKIGDKYTSHLGAFNTAFNRSDAYADIPIDGTPTTGRFGMNGIFTYNPPGDQPLDVTPSEPKI